MKKIVLAVGVLGLVASSAAVGCGGDDDEPAATAGGSGSGGASAGSAGAGGSKAGSGGTAAGAGGTAAGAGGSTAGSGGSTAGAGGDAGAGGSTAGAGGTAAGAGGSTAGAGGTAAGAGGSTAGAGGSTAGAGGTAGGAAGAAGTGGAAGAAPADFSCVPVTAVDPKPAGTSVTFDFFVTNYSGGTPLDGYVLKACKKDDAACATPLDTKTSDAMGKVTFTVAVDANSAGFDGYIDATDPAKAAMFYPTLYAFGNHAAIGQLAGMSTWGVAVFPTGLFGAATAIGGVTVEKANGHGHVLHVTRDCNWAAATGVSVTPTAGADGAKTVIRYTAGSSLSKTATETSSSGAAFVFNVLAGNATVSASVAATSTALGSVTVPVRQDVLTVTSWYPKPIPAAQ